MFSLFSPDGKWLAYSAFDDGWFNLFRSRTDGSDRPLRLSADGRNHKPTSWSRDGEELLLNEADASDNRDIVVLDAARGTERSYLATRTNEIEATFSPDGNWVAYQSDETGTWEVYVRAYHTTAPGRQVSIGGGMGPRWNPQGGELFYQARTAMMAVSVRDGTATGVPRKLFSYRQSDDYRREFDVSPDGRKFLVIEPTDPRTSITLITNWFDDLNARVPIRKRR
jgi:Tol biopolymer transport system component